MKNKLCLLAVCAVMTSFAHAQSSVTLYGDLDTSIGSFSGQKGANSSGTSIGMHSGAVTPDVWGLKGREDLGGGLSAVFQVESEFNINTGSLGSNNSSNNGVFGRTSMVGLSDQSLGTVTVGRQFDPLVDLITPLTEYPTFGNGFATPGDIDNYGSSYSTDNSIKYASPNYNGLQWSAMYAFGGQAGALGGGQTYAFAAQYSNGPASFAAGYFRASNNGTTGTFDGLNSANVDSQAISGGFTSASSTQIIRAAGDYAVGPFNLGLSYSNVDYSNYATALGSGNDARFNTGQFYVNYHANPATVLGFGYDYTKGSGSGVNAIYNQFSLGADYALSKRTDLYALAGYQRARGNTINGSTGQVTVANASFSDFGNDASGDSQTMVLFGIRHKF